MGFAHAQFHFRVRCAHGLHGLQRGLLSSSAGGSQGLLGIGKALRQRCTGHTEHAAAVAMHFGYRRVGHHAGGRAHGIGHIAMRWKDHLAIQPARQFAVKNLHWPAHRYHRHGRFDADARQAQGLLAVANRVADAVFG